MSPTAALIAGEREGSGLGGWVPQPNDHLLVVVKVSRDRARFGMRARQGPGPIRL
jgi:hypothetical protein